jgi:hypothetical protein
VATLSNLSGGSGGRSNAGAHRRSAGARGRSDGIGSGAKRRARASAAGSLARPKRLKGPDDGMRETDHGVDLLRRLAQSTMASHAETVEGNFRLAAALGGLWEARAHVGGGRTLASGASPRLLVRFQRGARKQDRSKWAEECVDSLSREDLRRTVRFVLHRLPASARENMRLHNMAQASPRVFWALAMLDRHERRPPGDLPSALSRLLPDEDWSFLRTRLRAPSKKALANRAAANAARARPNSSSNAAGGAGASNGGWATPEEMRRLAEAIAARVGDARYSRHHEHGQRPERAWSETGPRVGERVRLNRQWGGVAGSFAVEGAIVAYSAAVGVGTGDDAALWRVRLDLAHAKGCPAGEGTGDRRPGDGRPGAADPSVPSQNSKFIELRDYEVEVAVRRASRWTEEADAHPFLGKAARRFFPTWGSVDGTVVAYAPAGTHAPALWRIRHTCDGEEEEVGEAEVRAALEAKARGREAPR